MCQIAANAVPCVFNAAAPPVRFRMASTPVPVSVASVLGELVVDPTNAEEKIATATVSAVAIDSNQVSQLPSPGRWQAGSCKLRATHTATLAAR